MNVAYKSGAVEVVEAWQDFQARMKENRAKREEMVKRFGRDLWVNRSGFGHGTRVVGFDELPGDTEETLPPELRKNKTTGRIEPNRRRKAGKDLDAELEKLTTRGPELPGMPAWTLVGLSVLAPAISEIDGEILMLWGDAIEGSSNSPSIDAGLWERVPLSEYYAKIEAAEQEAS